MKSFKQYGWALKLVAAALLLALGIILILNDGEMIIAVFMGSVIIIYSVIRLIPFIKTQGSELVKTVNIIEITLSVIVGLILILVPTVLNMELGNLFSYLIGGYLMVRGTVHFFGVSLGKEKSDAPLFIFHILALTVGSYIFTTWGNFEISVILYIILVFSFGTATYLSYDGYKGFNKYRIIKSRGIDASVTEETSDDVKIEKILPVTDEEKEQDTVVS